MRSILAVVAVLVAVPGAVTSIHLTTLTLASLFWRSPRPARVPGLRFLVVVPARNEEAVIRDTLVSIEACRRPGDEVLVVADRCTDRTAAIALELGARLLERAEGSPPGRAASLRDGLAFAGAMAWDAVVFVDADSLLADGFFEACETVLASGAGVAQARSEATPGQGVLAQAAVAASAIGGVTVPRGRDRLGGWVRLKGSGMVLRRDIAEQHQFGASGASEDGQLSLDLCLAGVVHRHVDAARLSFAAAGDFRTASGQKLRYEAGRVYTARRYVPRLLRAHTVPAFDAAVHLCSPPLAFAVLLVAVAGGLAGLAGWRAGVVASVALAAMLGFDVAVGLVQARASRRVWMALLLAPLYVLWKAGIQVLALARSGSAARPYEPTARGPSKEGQSAGPSTREGTHGV